MKSCSIFHFFRLTSSLLETNTSQTMPKRKKLKSFCSACWIYLGLVTMATTPQCVTCAICPVFGSNWRTCYWRLCSQRAAPHLRRKFLAMWHLETCSETTRVVKPFLVGVCVSTHVLVIYSKKSCKQSVLHKFIVVLHLRLAHHRFYLLIPCSNIYVVQMWKQSLKNASFTIDKCSFNFEVLTVNLFLSIFSFEQKSDWNNRRRGVERNSTRSLWRHGQLPWWQWPGARERSKWGWFTFRAQRKCHLLCGHEQYVGKHWLVEEWDK